MKPSQFNQAVPVGQEFLVHNAESGAMALLDRDAYQATVRGDLSSPHSSDLLEGGFLIEAGKDEAGELRQRYHAWQQDRSVFALTIAPTMSCDFGCRYCFERDVLGGPSMLPSVQDGLIEFAKRHLSEASVFSVAWFGGEPLLALPVLRRLSERFLVMAAHRDCRYVAAVITNGYHLTAAVAHHLWDLGVQVAQVTLDGPQELHDQRRPKLGGQPTFQRIIDNLLAVSHSSQLQLTIRVNLDKTNAQDAQALLDYLSDIGLKGHPNVSIYFAPVTCEGGGGEPGECFSTEEFADWQSNLCHHSNDLGLSKPVLPERVPGPCGAVRANSFVVDPFGRLFKCWAAIGRPWAAVGHVCNPELIDQSRWLSYDPFSKPGTMCSTCSVAPLCMGGCPLPSIRSNDRDPSICGSIKHNLKETMFAVTDQSLQREKTDLGFHQETLVGTQSL